MKKIPLKKKSKWYSKDVFWFAPDKKNLPPEKFYKRRPIAYSTKGCSGAITSFAEGKTFSQAKKLFLVGTEEWMICNEYEERGFGEELVPPYK